MKTPAPEYSEKHSVINKCNKYESNSAQVLMMKMKFMACVIGIVGQDFIDGATPPTRGNVDNLTFHLCNLATQPTLLF